MARRGWRWWFRTIHRDVGYLCVGLVLIYSISGIAVNHVEDWNPNYSIEVTQSNIGPVAAAGSAAGRDDEAVARDVLERLHSPTDFRTVFVPEPGQLRIIRTNHTIDVELENGDVRQERVTPRFLLREANSLHLNHPKRLWTWIADAFAVALIVLAITGMFMLKGKKGITGRGAWLTATGFAVPLFFLWLYA